MAPNDSVLSPGSKNQKNKTRGRPVVTVDTLTEIQTVPDRAGGDNAEAAREPPVVENSIVETGAAPLSPSAPDHFEWTTSEQEQTRRRVNKLSLSSRKRAREEKSSGPSGQETFVTSEQKSESAGDDFNFKKPRLSRSLLLSRKNRSQKKRGNLKRQSSVDEQESPPGIMSYHHTSMGGHMMHGGGSSSGLGHGSSSSGRYADHHTSLSSAGSSISHASNMNSKYSSSSSGIGSATSSAVNGSSSKSPSIASLCNLGNTCFLNSVLYTLRFTPGFIHNLHHMVNDLNPHQSNGRRGRVNGFVNGSSDNGDSTEAELSQDVIEKLHDLFKDMSCADESSDSSREPIPPSSFLNSVGRLNPMFEGNQQQDAHELLVMILNILEDIKLPTPQVPETEFRSEGNLTALDARQQDKKTEKKAKKMGKSKLLNGGSSSGLLKGPHYVNGGSQQILNGTNGHQQNGLHSSHSANSLNQRSNGGPDSRNSSPAPPPVVPNFVKENFEGKSVMTTRCLECEMSTHCSEKFTNIDVPLQLDDDDVEELSGRELFLKQILMSETLRENNKYWCEECSRLNEARRSVQFELLPKVMVLQLKRFTTTGSKSYMSKINDYIPTPFTMNCFCTECIPPSKPGMPPPHESKTPPKHLYRLYAVIMHLGATLASGHYIAYVRASDPSLDVGQLCQRGNTVERNKNKKGILKYLRRNTEPKNGGHGGASNGFGSGDLNGAGPSTTPCRSSNCCGIRGGLLTNASTSTEYHNRSFDDASSVSSKESQVQSSASQLELSSLEDLWLECDDETITVLTKKQFDDILGSKKAGSTTPYLLFYQRV